MKKSWIIFLIFNCIVLKSGWGQKITFPAELVIQASDIRPITEARELLGYYVFKQKEVDKDVWERTLLMINSNLEIAKKTTFTAQTHWSALGAICNGKSLCVVSKDLFKSIGQLDFYDLDGTLLNSVPQPDIDRNRDLYFDRYYFPVTNQGFIVYGGYEKGRKSIEFYSSDGKRQYEIKPGLIPKIKGNKTEEEAIDYYTSSDSLLVIESTMYIMDYGAFAERSRTDYYLYNLHTGAKLGTVLMRHKKGLLRPLSTQADKNGITFYGQYVAYKENSTYAIINERAAGLYMQRYNNNGKLIGEHFVDGMGDLAAIHDAQNEPLWSERNRLFFTDFFAMKDGNTYIVCEAYQLTNKAGFEIVKNGDIVVLVFDSEFAYKGIHRFDKTDQVFIHQYSSMDPERTSFSLMYTQSASFTESKIATGAVGLNIDGEIVNTSIDQPHNLFDVAFLRAKTGYVALFVKEDGPKYATLTLYKLDM